MYELSHSDPQDTEKRPAQYTGTELAKSYPDIARLVFTLPAGAELILTSEHPNGEPFVITVKVIEPEPCEVIENRVWFGFTISDLVALSNQIPSTSDYAAMIERGKQRLEASVRGTAKTLNIVTNNESQL